VYSQSSEINNSRVGLVVARELEASSVRAGILLSGQVNGDVETILDTPRALLAGLTAGVVTGLVMFFLRMISNRR
jgi:hypothetical protein